MPRRLEERDRLLASDAGKVVEKLFERVTALEIVKQGADGNASTDENRFAAEDAGI